jgi:superfamily II DNA/RNA helicase
MNISEKSEEKTDKDYQSLDYEHFDEFLCDYHETKLMKGVYAYGFERPSQIQAKAIQPICDKRDLIAQAKSGSGKTGAFTIGVLTRVDPSCHYPQAIILGNTRELAVQIFNVIKNIGNELGIYISLCIGGIAGKDVMTNLKEASRSQILVGTPGRIVDLINRDDNRHSRDDNKHSRDDNKHSRDDNKHSRDDNKHSRDDHNVRKKNNVAGLFDRLRVFVLDEADKLLSDDFLQQIQNIITKIPRETQVCLFSATYTPEILALTEKFMSNPVKILVEPENVSVELIRNYYVNAEYEDNKYDILAELYQKVSVCQAVIFVNTVRKAIEVAGRLQSDGHSVGLIHSKMDDVERIEVLKKFRLTQTRILVATDIISRGIDVQQVGLVINYDVPYEPESYIHRVGRSGRYGKVGIAITLITGHRADIGRMSNIEKDYDIKFMVLPVLETVNNFLTGHNGYTYTDST